DLYSLGALLYHLTTGAPPFAGDDPVTVISQHLYTAPVAPRARNPTIPPELERLLLALLAKAPEERPASAEEVKSRLDRLKATSLERPLPPLTSARTSRLGSGFFVGRDVEMETLRARLEEALSGQARLVLLVGEPGIGKTRIAEQLSTHAQLRGARVLVGRCDEAEGAPAFWPWVQILRTVLAEREGDMLKEELGPGAIELAQMLPEIRALVPGSAGAAGPEAQFRLFDAVATLLFRASESRPLVLFLDDLHWADKSSALLVRFLARQMAGAPILVLGTLRDVDVPERPPFAEVLPSLLRERGCERIVLHGLPAPEVRALLTAIGGREFPEDLAAAIFRETEGNPFFVEEVLRHLIDEEVLVREGERWKSRLAAQRVGLPESIREVLRRRLSRLTPACRAMLVTAAAIGRDFEPALLVELGGGAPGTTAALLEDAVTARIIRRMPWQAEQLSFSHALIREALYAELEPAERGRLHRRIGETLEPQAEEHLGELAHHFFEGGDAARAIDYAVRAAERAASQLAYEEAGRLYERALRALDEAEGDVRELRCDLRLRLGRVSWIAGDIRRAKEAFRSAAALAEALGSAPRLARAALGYGGPYAGMETGEVDRDLIELLEKALAAVGDADPGLRGRLLGRLAVALAFSEGRQRKEAYAREAVEIARRAGDDATLARVLIGSHFVTWRPDNLDERLDVTREIIDLGRRLDDDLVEAEGNNWRNNQLLEIGDRSGADRCRSELERLAEAHPQHFMLRWNVLLQRARWALLEGRLEEAERLSLEALGQGQEGKNQAAGQNFAAQMLFCRREQGRLGEVVEPLRVLVARYPSIPSWRAALAWIYAELAQPAAAQVELDRSAAKDFDDLPEDLFWMAFVWCLAEAVVRLRDARRAERLYAMLLPFAGRCVTIPSGVFAGSVARVLGGLATTLERDGDASRHFEEALRIDAAMGTPLWLARSRVDYARLLLARSGAKDRAKALDHLQEALATSRRLGLEALGRQALALRLEAQGSAPADARSSIEVVADSVRDRRADFRPAAAPDGTITIMFSDIERSTEMFERLGDAAAYRILQRHNSIVREHVAACRGFEVEFQGDGFVIAFASARDALRCAVELQRSFAGYNRDNAEVPIRVRIGLHSGEAIREADRFFGRTVILAARIASQARGGEILVSSVLRELVASLGEFRFGAEREDTLKGLAGTHLLPSVVWQDEGETEPVIEAPAPAEGESLFRRCGDYWKLGFASTSLRLRDAKGLRYIARLLETPGVDVHVLDLVGNGSASPRPGGDAGEV
ncbi:MAG: AAA family ATPase, partial [Candidatus Binatia bacterium]